MGVNLPLLMVAALVFGVCRVLMRLVGVLGLSALCSRAWVVTDPAWCFKYRTTSAGTGFGAALVGVFGFAPTDSFFPLFLSGILISMIGLVSILPDWAARRV